MTRFPWSSRALLGWRVDAADHKATWDSGRGAELAGGRWNPRGYPVVYTSVDPSTSVLEVAVHKGFDTLDRRQHVVSCLEILDPSLVHVVEANDVRNPNWLRPGTSSYGQQQFGKELLEQYAFVAVPSAVLSLGWNIVFNPRRAAGAYKLREQADLELDTRLNRPPS